MQSEESIIRLSGDDIIELIRDNRNDLIKKLLNDNTLRSFLSENYNLQDVSNVKIEFIKLSLKELSVASVDLSHYGPLILDIRKTGSMILSKTNESFFVSDIEKTIKNYIL